MKIVDMRIGQCVIDQNGEHHKIATITGTHCIDTEGNILFPFDLQPDNTTPYLETSDDGTIDIVLNDNGVQLRVSVEDAAHFDKNSIWIAVKNDQMEEMDNIAKVRVHNNDVVLTVWENGLSAIQNLPMIHHITEP